MKIIIDCSWLCYRSSFGIGDLSYNNRSVHIIFDFLRHLLKLAMDFNHPQFVFCWDSKNSWRKIYSPIYKGNRGTDLTSEELAVREDIYGQINDLRKIVLPYMGFKNSFWQNGYEADDLIASVVQSNYDDFVIVAADEDLFQLLANNVQLFNLKRIYKDSDFNEQFGIQPNQWAEVKAIAGCSGDNIIGIKGVGDKTAAKYLRGELKGKAKEGIESIKGCQIKEFNLFLTLLPFKGSKPLKSCLIVSDDLMEDAFKAIFGQYGFKSFLKDEQWAKWQEAFELRGF